jgi:predicted MFS family arabinose efflux permease
MGIFNSITALAAMMGAAIGGWIASLVGYNTMSGVALAGVALGSLQTSSLHEKRT